MKRYTHEYKHNSGVTLKTMFTAPYMLVARTWNLLFKVAQPTAEMRVLDVATGGHTALRFAHAVKEVVATDLTQAMLIAAQNHILPQATNVRF
ncbi:MAG UNVERIFIED_CONTAM: class I SAM-dependent methyltransferase [Anaerolineae bacterium]|jgi:ubiquinone/menaquinone biosynthesis C-methylase UbiE